MSEKKIWIFITEWISVLGTLIACFLFLHSQIQGVSNRLDAQISISNQRFDQENQRIDQMYYVLLESLRNK